MNTITIESIGLYLIFHCFSFFKKINIIFLHIIFLFQKLALWFPKLLQLLLLSRFSRVRLCETPQTAANQAPLSWHLTGCSSKELAYFIVILFHLVQWCHLQAWLCIFICMPKDTTMYLVRLLNINILR